MPEFNSKLSMKIQIISKHKSNIANLKAIHAVDKNHSPDQIKVDQKCELKSNRSPTKHGQHHSIPTNQCTSTHPTTLHQPQKPKITSRKKKNWKSNQGAQNSTRALRSLPISCSKLASVSTTTSSAETAVKTRSKARVCRAHQIDIFSDVKKQQKGKRKGKEASW